ncbi:MULTISPECIES: hypothetical protein [Winogradskyella]|uniref:Uncharacterized protein n=1 Tax=Winogradskyella ouciana TaxID=2608631 RepID=A0A7K1G8A8_9FLAO|nr:hypothetical protein [Winogradskyella ouciana]MTE25510.1 hypothetical protein [Winogradskyella ouciana]
MLKLKTHKYYFFLALLMALAYLISKLLKLTFVFNIVGTYSVILYSDIFVFMFLSVLILALIYWSLFKGNIKLIDGLSKIHTTITIAGVLLFTIFLSFYDFVSPSGANSRFPLFDNPIKNTKVLVTIIVTVSVSQLILILNIVISLVKYFQKTD